MPERAFLCKAVLPRLLQVSDTARRVFLGLSRFAQRRNGLTYPSEKVLLRALGFKMLYRCYFCDGAERRLTPAQRRKQKAHYERAASIVRAALDELQMEHLLRSTTLHNAYATFPGWHLTNADGSDHSIYRRAPADSFFIVPGSIFHCGAAGIWAKKRDGLLPLSPAALRLLLVMLSENDCAQYGGVNPAIVSQNGLEQRCAQKLRPCTEDHLQVALAELLDRNIVVPRPCITSLLDGHFIRYGNDARGIDEIASIVFAVQEVGVWL